MKRIIILVMAILLAFGVNTNILANSPENLSDETIKNIAIEFTESSLSDFSDYNSDYLIDENATQLKEFLKDKRALKIIKEEKLGRRLNLIDLEIKDVRIEELGDNCGVTLKVAVNFLDGDVKSSLEYFNAIVINKITG